MAATTNFEIVVVAYRSRFVLEPFLERLGDELPVLIVDNSFGDEDLSDLVAKFSRTRHFDSGGNLGFSAAANLGAKEIQGDYLVFLNPDTRPTTDRVRALVQYLDDNPDVACVGAMGEGSAGGGAQPTARRLLVHAMGLHRLRSMGTAGIFYHLGNQQRADVEWVAGSCMAIRRDVFEEFGGFDEDYFIYLSDFDLGRRLSAAGHRQVVLGDVIVPHHGGGSSELPSLWTWERRGRSWPRYLRNTRPVPVAIGLSLILAAGHAGRVVVYTLTGQRNRALEMWTYLRSMFQEWASIGNSHEPPGRPRSTRRS